MPVLTLPPWLNRTDPPSLEELVDRFDLFAFTCCVVSDRQGDEVPFIENPMQWRVNQLEDEMRAELGYAWLYQLKMRRGGLSMNTQLRNFWRTWRKPNTRGITLAHERESTDEIFQITRLAVQRFPPELLPPLGRERQRAVSFPGMGSRFLTGTAGATGIGRGSDFSFLHISEFAFVKDPKGLHTAASQAVRKDGTYIRETTASSYDSDPHKMWQEAREGRSKFRAVFFPWWWRDDAVLPLLELDELDPLSAEEQELRKEIFKHELWLVTAYYQRAPDPAEIKRRVLGRLKWRRDKIREIGAQDFDREYPKDDTSCWLVAGTPYFDIEALKYAREHTVRSPLRREWNDELRIYGEPDPNRRYLIGGDPSEGVEGDRSALCVLDFDTFEQVAAFASRTAPPEQLADRAVTLGQRYANARLGVAVQVPEINAAGHTMVYQMLRVLKYPKSRIWHHTKQVRNVRTQDPGWRTTEETKYIALDEAAQLLRERVQSERPLLRDQATVEDLMAVQRGKTGTVEMTGRDEAQSWMLAYQGRKHPVSSGFRTSRTGEEESDTAATISRRH